MPPPLTRRDVDRVTSVRVLVNATEVRRALRGFNRDLERETRREMAALAREARDDIRGDWPVGPNRGGHSRLAVTSGTKGLIPYVALRRDYRSYVGWLVWGGRRPRDRRRNRRGRLHRAHLRHALRRDPQDGAVSRLDERGTAGIGEGSGMSSIVPSGENAWGEGPSV